MLAGGDLGVTSVEACVTDAAVSVNIDLFLLYMYLVQRHVLN